MSVRRRNSVMSREIDSSRQGRPAGSKTSETETSHHRYEPLAVGHAPWNRAVRPDFAEATAART